MLTARARLERLEASLRPYIEEDKQRARLGVMVLGDEDWDELKRREDLRRLHGVSCRDYANPS